MQSWPASVQELVGVQAALAKATPPAWTPGSAPMAAGACFVCFARGPSGPGRAGDLGWAGAAIVRGQSLEAVATAAGAAPARFEPGLLALREGPLLESAVHLLPRLPEVLVVNATGRDHPRGAGLALQLGAVLDVPTVGVTHRPLLAEGAWPDEEQGAATPLRIRDDVVGYWVRTRAGTRPLAVHAAWRVDAETAVQVVLAFTRPTRTPEPLRQARRLARSARAAAMG